MADEVHHPHDNMVHTVLRDPTEATSFLQAHLPQDVSQGLNWATLRLHDRTFVDEALREGAPRIKQAKFSEKSDEPHQPVHHCGRRRPARSLR